jgi:hypothetical protein
MKKVMYKCIKAYPGIVEGQIALPQGENDFGFEDKEFEYYEYFQFPESYFKDNSEYWERIEEDVLPESLDDAINWIKEFFLATNNFHAEKYTNENQIYSMHRLHELSPTEEIAFSVRAYQQLMLIWHGYNVPMDCGYYYYPSVKDDCIKVLVINRFTSKRSFPFDTEEKCKHFIDRYDYLLRKFYHIKKK